MGKYKKIKIVYLLIVIFLFDFVQIYHVYAREIISISVNINETNLVEGRNTKDCITVIGIDENGNSIELHDYEVEPAVLKLEDTQLTVSYTNNGKIFNKSLEISVQKKELIGLEIELLKEEYIVGQEINQDNVKIWACYNDGTRKDVTQESTFDYNTLTKIGSNQVIIHYTENDISKSKTVEIKAKEKVLQSIYASYDKETLEENEGIDRSYLNVIGTYNDGSSIPITEYTILPYKIENGKKTQVTVYYEGLTCMFEVAGDWVEATTCPETQQPVISEVTATPTVTETPKQTNKPQNTETPKQTDKPQNTKVPKTSFKLKSNIKNIKLANKTKTNYFIITKKDINLVLTTKNAQNIKYQIVSEGKKVNKKAWKKVKKSKVTIQKDIKRSVIYFQYTNAEGKKTTAKTTGFTLDKTPPKITGVKNKNIYKRNVRIVFKDNGSGIKKVTLNGKTIKNRKIIKSNGTYQLEVVDKAGNKKKVVFTMKKEVKKSKVTATKAPIVTPIPVKTTDPTAVPSQKPKSIAVKSISLNKGNLVLNINQTAKLTAYINPTNATNQSLTWKSCNTSVVTVSNGTITAKGKGVTTIIVYSKSNTAINASCTIIVN